MTGFRGRPRWTLQLRLALLYGSLFVVSGTLLLFILYLVARPLNLLTVAPPAPSVPSALPLGMPTMPSGVPGSLPLPTPLLVPTSVPAPGPIGVASRQSVDMRKLLVASGAVLAGMTVISVGLGWLMARRALRPLRTMALTARAISERSLHRRLAVQGPQDEIKGLADTFDGLLERLEDAFQAQRRFVANASHELRTPLTLSRSLLEIALADPDATTPDLRRTCQRVLVSNQHLERLIEALLTLARSQRGLDVRVELDLAEAAAQCVDAFEDEAAARRCRIEASFGVARTEGDAGLIERLIGNLVDNAVRYNVPDGRITVWTGLDAGRPALRVVNSGPEIAPTQIDALFEPFHRLDTTRGHSEQDGLGVGLSIVAAIALAHGAELRAGPGPDGGLDVRIGFRPVPARAAARAGSEPPPVIVAAE
ncbi:sensor histidine kinase [Catenulispora rubra]|uniref:sensor histidine kinase n=1 Tax=Catenulispora rubra TaxID=280293 RepID=UPI0018927136|nr:ATP-binding protein [Catenulispora rubra]